MEIHRGRLIDRVRLFTADIEKSRTFYRAVAESLGHGLTEDAAHAFALDEIYVTDQGEERTGATHIALQAPSAEHVQAFFDAGSAAGGVPNGSPGLRPHHKGYYSAYVMDPDGNNIEAVFHGPQKRSAASVVIHPEI